ncbi:MAG TPA: T9SS type A sorting domain-containing protein, partial [Ferruginibacter sp.]|nr:T9SS type A sorting domain-containing protein [Ferruginibacter sp.]
AYTITTGDLDKDGDTDIVASNGEFWWFENQIIQEPSATQFVPASSVRIYPNPVNDVLYFENPDSDACTLELINLQGEIVLRTESTNNNIPMRQVQPGVYKVRIINHQKQSAGCSTVIKI